IAPKSDHLWPGCETSSRGLRASETSIETGLFVQNFTLFTLLILIKTVFTFIYLFMYQHEKELHTLANALLEYETLIRKERSYRSNKKLRETWSWPSHIIMTPFWVQNGRFKTFVHVEFHLA